MPQELYQVLATLCIGIGSLSSAFVAFVGYKLQKREKDKSWLQVFRDLYSKFWSDSHMARVAMLHTRKLSQSCSSVSTMAALRPTSTKF